MPDMLSKKASTIDKLRLDSKKGMHPKIAILSQDKVVRRKACCKFSFLFSSRFVSIRSIPTKAVTDAEDRKVLFLNFVSNVTKIKDGEKIISTEFIKFETENKKEFEEFLNKLKLKV